jgi:hypothetical protein
MALSIITKTFVGVWTLISIAAKNKAMALKLGLQGNAPLKINNQAEKI